MLILEFKQKVSLKMIVLNYLDIALLMTTKKYLLCI